MHTTSALPLIHRFVPGTDPAQQSLLLLHGTGGEEDDLLPLGRTVAPGAALLSPRGAVTENGMPRFFRRLTEGVFDEADLRRRRSALAEFVAGAREEYGLAAPVAVGFSNGANIAAALLMLHPGVLAGAGLLRAMPPFREPPTASLPGTPVLLPSGAADPIVPAESAARLAAQLEAAGADITHRVLPAGHGLNNIDVQALAACHAETGSSMACGSDPARLCLWCRDAGACGAVAGRSVVVPAVQVLRQCGPAQHRRLLPQHDAEQRHEGAERLH